MTSDDLAAEVALQEAVVSARVVVTKDAQDLMLARTGELVDAWKRRGMTLDQIMARIESLLGNAIAFSISPDFLDRIQQHAVVWYHRDEA